MLSRWGMQMTSLSGGSIWSMWEVIHTWKSYYSMYLHLWWKGSCCSEYTTTPRSGTITGWPPFWVQYKEKCQSSPAITNGATNAPSRGGAEEPLICFPREWQYPLSWPMSLRYLYWRKEEQWWLPKQCFQVFLHIESSRPVFRQQSQAVHSPND